MLLFQLISFFDNGLHNAPCTCSKVASKDLGVWGCEKPPMEEKSADLQRESFSKGGTDIEKEKAQHLLIGCPKLVLKGHRYERCLGPRPTTDSA